jgi:hypothetical protein
MAKVAITPLERAREISPPAESEGLIESRAYFGKPIDPIHLQYHRASRRAKLEVSGQPTDRLVYVWKGSVEAGGAALKAGSSAIVEFGASLTLAASGEGATLLVFNVSERRPADREGGHVHLLPSESVSRSASFHGTAGIGGGLHADAQCPTCRVWLHEQVYEMADQETVLHSHSEDEVIFVTDGAIRLGQRLYGPGTALAIAANVKYGFHSGPAGLHFVNFRGSSPTYTSADGLTVLDEAKLWRSALGRPAYLSPRP